MTDDPLQLFHEWIGADEMALATATADGRPSLRMVLLKSADESGFAFFTNYESRKGRELAENPRAALLFRAPEVQVRVEGRVEKLPAAASDAYWASRPPGSRRSAAASRQSQPIGSRAELEARVAAEEARWPDTGSPDDVPAPSTWGGYLVRPDVVELWVGQRSRLHDRIVFVRTGRGDMDDPRSWRTTRLQP